MRLSVAGAIVSLALLAGAPAARCASLAATVTDADGKPVPNAVVVAVPEAGAPHRTGPPAVEVVDQIGKEFTPYVKPVRAGSLVDFPNKDNIRHHVYSFSPAKAFELPLYKGRPAQPVLFDRPGIVRLGCNIHDWMVGYIYVAETPWFGKTAASGRVELDKLPAGRYGVRVWHPWMEGAEAATAIAVEIHDGPATAVAWTLKLKPPFTSRRAPVPGDPGYR
jgi:plastocyanin